MVELGTKIIGNYGAMIPLWYGEVVVVETHHNIGPSDPEVKVRWDNGSTTWLVTDEIDANKGIGYFTEEGYYESA